MIFAYTKTVMAIVAFNRDYGKPLNGAMTCVLLKTNNGLSCYTVNYSPGIRLEMVLHFSCLVLQAYALNQQWICYALAIT